SWTASAASPGSRARTRPCCSRPTPPSPRNEAPMTQEFPRTATVRGIELGRARPEIIVPVVGEDEEAVLAQAQAAAASPARLVEWRLDRFRPDLRGAEAHREAALA